MEASEPPKFCPGCSTLKPLDEFNYKHKVTGKRQVRCRTCTRAQVRSHYERNHEYYIVKAMRRNKEVFEQQGKLLIEYLSEHSCVDCGESDVVCLDFDHVRGKKHKAISEMLGNYPWYRVFAEMLKCDVRCANCHRRKTAKQFGHWRSFIE